MIKLVFIDTETTGLDPKRHSIIQLSGSVVFYSPGTTTEIIETFDFRMRPFEGSEIEKEALLVNGLTEEEIFKYQSPQEVLKEFQKILEKYCDKFNKIDKMFFVGYNAKFDYDFIRAWFARCGDKYFGSWFWSPPIDVMNMAVIRLIEKRQLLENFKLEIVAKHFGILPKGEMHNSAVDIELTIKLFDELVFG